jgi:hypothetical protein
MLLFCLLIYPRMYVRQLFLIFSRVKLDLLEARLRPVEQLDRRPPWKAEGRTMQEQLSRSRDWVPIIRDV